MEPFQENMNEYRNQLEKGAIQKAYRGLIEYIMDLRTHFKNKYPGYFVSGSIYHGLMDVTFFTFFPEHIKLRNLKIVIVFSHDNFRFEAWLAGYSKKVQSRYWKLFKENGWNKYHLVPTTKGVDSILEHVLADNPDFSDLDRLTKQIESEALKFIVDVESFLFAQDD